MSDSALPATPGPLPCSLLANEFASVAIRVDRSANGPRLKITDLLTGTYWTPSVGQPDVYRVSYFAGLLRGPSETIASN